MAKPNPAIGTCPCPARGCDQVGQVKKFAHRSVTDQGRRNAGKLYLDCPSCGRFGFDGKQAMQDWILDHATLDGQAPKPAGWKPTHRLPDLTATASSAPVALASAPAAKPAAPASAPATAATAPASAPKRAPWSLLG